MSAAQLDLGFRKTAGGRTELCHRRASYPWSLTQPFHLDDRPAGMATVIPQSLSGGLFRDEVLDQRIAVAAGAAVHFASQGATVVHAARDGAATQTAWRLSIADGGLLEVVLDPLVLAADAALDQRWRIELAPRADLLVIDGWTWLHQDGAPAFRAFRNDVCIARPGGAPLALERTRASAAALLRQQAAAARPIGAFITAIIAGPVWREAAAARGFAADLADLAKCWSGVSALPGGVGLVARAIAEDAGAVAAWTEAVWHAARRRTCGALPASRRRGL